MASTPIYNWPTPDNTGLVKNGALDMRTLGNAIDTTMGTMVAKTIVDAKGDLIAGTAADTTARLAVGANNTFLRANSSAATGLEYAGAYTTFTPSWINLTVGNGTNTGRYLRIGNFVHVEQKLTFGSTTTIAGGTFCGFPIAANTTNNELYSGNLILIDNGVQNYFGEILMVDTSNFLLKPYLVSGTRVVQSDLSSTAPFTWAAGDIIGINYVYEVA